MKYFSITYKHGMPFVSLKYAMTLDGKIATYTGNSKWITGEASRKSVHELRKKYSAILARNKYSKAR